MAFVCSACGNEPSPGATFCRHCGAQLNAGAAAAIPVYNPSAPVPPPALPPQGSYGQAPPPPQASYPSYNPGQYSMPSYPPPQQQYGYDPNQAWQQQGGYYPGQAAPLMAMQPSPYAANPNVNPLKRWLAYFLDVLPMGFIHLIGMIPVVGNIIGGALGILYMLFRDAMGASVGKQIVGNAIVTTAGTVPTKRELVMRNVPLAIPYLFLMIPLIGPIVCLIVGAPIFLAEHIMALLTGLRIGDRLAGTRVVDRT